ncbi:MAG: hypothetical protein HY070_01465 [Chloroflexi bacterium]|nr:hypothetical protein [Chloroflexota bacterium]MBI3741044.1 hypothetical protein [Chloroflexota bacterium]
MKNLYWVLGLGGFALLVGAISIIVFKNTSFRPLPITTQSTFQTKSTTPPTGNQSTPGAVTPRTEQINRLYGPGIQKLLDFSDNYREMVLSTMFVVDLKGTLESLTETSLVLTNTAKNKTLTIPLEISVSQKMFYFEKTASTDRVVRTIQRNDIQKGDTIEVRGNILPTNGKFIIETITRIQP